MTGSEGGVCNFVSNTDGGGNIITPTSDQFLQANAILDDQGATQMDRRIVNSPTTDARTTTALQGLLNPATEISAQFRSGMMKSGLGYDRWFRDQTVITHTSGTYANASTVNGGNQFTGTGGGNIAVTALGGTLRKGDIITFAGTNGVNRTTKQSQGTLRQFVVTADCAVGAVAIPVYPGLIPSATFVAGGPDQQYQTVDASPINGAAVTMVSKALKSIASRLPILRRPLPWLLRTLCCPVGLSKKVHGLITMALQCVSLPTICRCRISWQLGWTCYSGSFIFDQNG